MGGFFHNTGGTGGGGPGGAGTVTAPFVKSWLIADWVLNGAVYQYVIPASEHNKSGSIDVETFIADGVNWDEVQVAIQVNVNNDVIIICGDLNDRFDARVNISGAN